MVRLPLTSTSERKAGDSREEPSKLKNASPPPLPHSAIHMGEGGEVAKEGKGFAGSNAEKRGQNQGRIAVDKLTRKAPALPSSSSSLPHKVKLVLEIRFYFFRTVKSA